MKAEIIYYEPVELSLDGVKLRGLKIAGREEVEVGDEKDVSRLYERLARLVAEAKRRRRSIVIEARVSSEGKEVYYAESTLGGGSLLYYRPALLKSIIIVRESGGKHTTRRIIPPKGVYVFEGELTVLDHDAVFVIVETEDGKRLLRRGEFRVAGERGGGRGSGEGSAQQGSK